MDHTTLAAAEAARTDLVDVGLHDTITAIGPHFENEFYPIDKLEAHTNDVPHMAVSVFIFHRKKLLLQQRAHSKYHSGGLWANTVCSHPKWSETVQACAPRRLMEELGISCDLKEFGTIGYRAKVGELYENERVHCFVGHLDDQLDYDKLEGGNLLDGINPLEVCEVQWLTLDEIQQTIEKTPAIFTEWFKIYMSTHRELIDVVVSQ